MNARTLCLLTMTSVATVLPASANALRELENQSSLTHYATDDDSTDPVSLGFSFNFFGTDYSQLFLNNNGNATFAFPSGLGNPASVAGGLAEQGGPVLAPFFADVDTTYLGSLIYGSGTIGGFNAFTATWTDVAAFGNESDRSLLNTFQLFLVDRSDTGAGNFDFEFNYAKINWDQGANSTGIGALAGFSDAAATTYLLAGSGQTGAFLDSSASGQALITHYLGTPFDDAVLDGRYAFNVRGGEVTVVEGGPVPHPVPESSTFAAFACTVFAMLLRARGQKTTPST